MFYLLLVSGAAFVAGGAVLAAQARVIEVGLPLPRAALGLLAGFAVARGASDWAELALIADRQARGSVADALPILHLVLLAASYALLLEFALALRGRARRRLSFAPGVGVVALVAWGGLAMALLQGQPGGHRTVPPGSVEVLTRCLLGLPASLCAALGLLALAPSLELESWVESRLVRWAGLVVLVHGAADAAGALSGTHAAIPLGIVETGSAAAIAVLLSEAFVFQTSQRLRREETHLRDDFVGLVAHELGNPLAALELATARLELSRRAERGVDARLSEDVKACTFTLRRIVTDLLDTSGVRARRLEITPTPVDLRPALERAAELASGYQGRRRAVRVTCPDDLPPALADPARLEQVLGNLLTNASKYSAPGSEVVVAAERCGRGVTIRVVNEGPCIDPAEASRIFSRHYRTDAATRGAARGLGLGLYVARALVEAQGGRIWVESHGERTAFCFTLPQPASTPGAVFASGDEAPFARS